tara:strand:+ start:1874 stop:2263 length:390 start_codon:yes stop_codon:yes gene_type:complete
MPEVKNEKGEVIASMPYSQVGQQQAQKMVSENQGYTINDASQRNVQTYAGGGKTGYNVPMYKEGGKTKGKSIIKELKKRMSDEDMVLDIKNKEKVKDYENRFLTKQEKIEKGWKMKATKKMHRKKKLKK